MIALTDVRLSQNRLRWAMLSFVFLLLSGLSAARCPAQNQPEIERFQPDVEFEMAPTPHQIPEAGSAAYQYFVVDPKFTEDRWVVAAHVTPGNRSVVQHATVFVRPPEGERQPDNGWLAAWTPGQNRLPLPEGMARRIPKRSKLVFQILYAPIGSVVEDTTRVGLTFAVADAIHWEVQTRTVMDRDFEIPPGDKDFQVPMTIGEFPPHSQLLGITPQMRSRGKSFRVTAEQQNSNKILLDVPNYEFQQQPAYALDQPLPLDGTTLRCVATFDNSEQNPHNPDPTATVRWGERTDDETAMAYLTLAVPRTASKPQGATPTAKQAAMDQRQVQSWEEREREAENIARKFFEQLDRNQDGKILRGETPASFRTFAWREFDKDENDKLSWKEVLDQARLSLRP